jgi:hypothetical protein
MRSFGVVVFLALAGCSRCGAPAKVGTPIERVLPRKVQAAVVVPSLEALGAKLTLLQQLKVASFLAPTQGFADAKGFADALVNDLGLDLRSREAMVKAGLDPSRAAGAVLLPSNAVVLALPVADASVFEATLTQLSVRRLGAGVKGEAPPVKTFAAVAGGPVRAGFVLTQGFALVAVDDAVKLLPLLAALKEADSLSADAVLTAERSRLPATREVYAYLPAGSPLIGSVPVVSAVGALSLSATAFALNVDAVLRDAPRFAGVLEARSADDLTPVLPVDAFVVASFAGSPVALAPFATSWLGASFTHALGVDLSTEVLAHVKPGVAVALSLADRPPLSGGLPEFDVRKTNPFSYVNLSGVAQVDSAEVVVPTLEKVAAAAPGFGAKLKKVERNGATAFLTSWAQGEGVHFGLQGDRVSFASPVNRLDALMTSTAALGAAGVRPTSVRVDLTKLAASVKALPESSWGLGGFAMKATALRWLEATDDLVAIEAEVSAKDGAAQARVTLQLANRAK